MKSFEVVLVVATFGKIIEETAFLAVQASKGLDGPVIVITVTGKRGLSVTEGSGGHMIRDLVGSCA